MNPLRHVRSLARSIGVEISRYPVMHRVADILVARGRPPSFLQIGGNDGIHSDDVSPMVRKHRLSGVILEPVPDYFATLSRIYSREPQVTCINAALHPSAKSAQIHFVKPEMATELWHHGLASFNLDTITSHGIPPANIGTIKVPCVSLGAVMADHFSERPLDMLVIDTEGFDGEIMRMVDWSEHRPAYVQFERKHLPAEEQAYWERQLRSLGYHLTFSLNDCMATLPGVTGVAPYLSSVR